MTSDKLPKFSIVIPAYNVSKYIEQSLLSIKRQGYKDYECIVVNDGSTDDTKKRIQKVIDQDKRFQLINQKNKGLSGARNTGLRAAIGQYIIFLDGDDFFEPTLLSTVNTRIKETGAEVIVYNSNNFNSQTGKYGPPNIFVDDDIVLNNKAFTAKDINEHIFNIFFNSVWSKVFKRQLLLDNKLEFNEKLHRIEDLPFTNPALVMAQSISFIDEVLLHYRMNIQYSNTVSNYKYPLDIVTSAEQFYNFLKNKDELEHYEQSFYNAVLNDCEYYLWWVAPYPQGNETFDAINKMLLRFGLSEKTQQYFYREQLFELLKIIQGGEYDAFLRYLIQRDRLTRQDTQDFAERQQDESAELKAVIESRQRDIVSRDETINSLEKNTDALRDELYQLQRSKSYRVGRVILKPLSYLKKQVQR